MQSQQPLDRSPLPPDVLRFILALNDPGIMGFPKFRVLSKQFRELVDSRLGSINLVFDIIKMLRRGETKNLFIFAFYYARTPYGKEFLSRNPLLLTIKERLVSELVNGIVTSSDLARRIYSLRPNRRSTPDYRYLLTVFAEMPFDTLVAFDKIPHFHNDLKIAEALKRFLYFYNGINSNERLRCICLKMLYRQLLVNDIKNINTADLRKLIESVLQDPVLKEDKIVLKILASLRVTLAAAKPLKTPEDWEVIRQGANRYINLRCADFQEGRLSGANLPGAYLEKADFSDADLTEANLAGSNLQKARFNRANLRNSNLSKTCMHEATFQAANLRNVNLQGAWAWNIIITNTNFSGANLTEASILIVSDNENNPPTANFQNAILQKVMMFPLHEPTFIDRTNILAGADLKDTRWPLFVLFNQINDPAIVGNRTIGEMRVVQLQNLAHLVSIHPQSFWIQQAMAKDLIRELSRPSIRGDQAIDILDIAISSGIFTLPGTSIRESLYNFFTFKQPDARSGLGMLKAEKLRLETLNVHVLDSMM